MEEIQPYLEKTVSLLHRLNQLLPEEDKMEPFMLHTAAHPTLDDVDTAEEEEDGKTDTEQRTAETEAETWQMLEEEIPTAQQMMESGVSGGNGGGLLGGEEEERELWVAHQTLEVDRETVMVVRRTEEAEEEEREEEGEEEEEEEKEGEKGAAIPSQEKEGVESRDTGELQKEREDEQLLQKDLPLPHHDPQNS